MIKLRILKWGVYPVLSRCVKYNKCLYQGEAGGPESAKEM